MDTVLKTMHYRKEHNILRPDMINLLMEAQGLISQDNEDAKHINHEWNDTEVVAQCLLFLVAGYETVATTLSFAAYELMANPQVQEKLFEEISQVSSEIGDGQLTYDVLQKMTYLDMVVSEVLRKWPGTLALDRVCNKDITYDLDNGEKLSIKAGQAIWFPLNALQMDPKYWPEPEKFMPERFSEENKANIHPNTYMPFGVGPRNCIG